MGYEDGCCDGRVEGMLDGRRVGMVGAREELGLSVDGGTVGRSDGLLVGAGEVVMVGRVEGLDGIVGCSK